MPRLRRWRRRRGFRAFGPGGRVKLLIPLSTIQETVYVLERLCHLDTDAIAPKLISLLTLHNVETPAANWVPEALQFYREKNSDFGDALLCAYVQSAEV